MKIMQIGRHDSFSTYQTWGVRIPRHPQRLRRSRNQLWSLWSNYITKRLSLSCFYASLLNRTLWPWCDDEINRLFGNWLVQEEYAS